MLTRALTCCLAVSVACLGAAAGTPAPEEGVDVAQIIATKMEGPPAVPPSPKGRLPKFEDVTKDMVSQEGLFTLWFYPPEAQDKDFEKLLCQVPAGFLGEKFMLSVSFSGGGFFTGFPLEERVVKWELLDRQLVLAEPETRFVVDDAHTVSDVVRRTYPDRIRTAVKLVTKSPAGDPVIDLGVMLKSNFADIAWTSLGARGSINPKLSKWTKRKTFELNVEIGVELALRRASPPGSYDKKLVHFSFWKLPQTDFTPRVADDRIGYFITANRDWAKPTDARDIFNRYIDRWHLAKRDPALPACEPKQPIIFYIEKTVPVRFRQAVRDGILEWNKAFEKIGFVNAIEVRQQTDDNEWKDLDPEDMRYSFFRWIVTGAGFAMGPHRANPFTGQIYDADIVFDDSMVRYFEQEAQTMLPSDLAALKTRDPAMHAFCKRHPQTMRPHHEWENLAPQPVEESVLREAMRRRTRERGHLGCDYAEGMKHQLALGQAVLAGLPKEVIDRLLYDLVKEVVTHEVGHTLGLRHNFKGSSIYSLDEIRRRRTTDEPTSGSIMDYNPALLFAKNPLEGHFATPTLGPYDYWAIEYGYRPADGAYEPTGKDDLTEAEGEEKTTPADPQTPPLSPDSAVIRLEGKEIPKALLDQLPTDVQKLITEKAAQEAATSAPESPEPAMPAFTGPNAAELKMLHAIASRAAEPELVYATDHDTTLFGPDPLAARFDMGSDPLEWARTRVELVDQRLDNVLKWAVKEGESWYYLRQSFVRLLFEKTLVLDYVGRYIGGQYTSRDHRGDPNARPPFRLVEPDRQREALAFIEQNLFQDSFFSFPPELLNHLTTPRWAHAGAYVDYTVDFPIHEFISFMQWWNLFDRLHPGVLRRVHDAELKATGETKFTVAEYLQRMQMACWSDVSQDRARQGAWTEATPFLSSIRRSLQREYLYLVEPLVRVQPGVLLSPDLHALLQHSLRGLADRVGQTLAAGGLDFASEAHLTSSASRIERMLTPKLDEYAWGGT